MRKRTGVALLMAGVIAGLVLTSIWLARTPAASETPDRQPVPTFTPTPSVSAAGYSKAATQAQNELADALDAVGQLVAAPHLADAAWSAGVQEAMTQVDSAYLALVRLDPPVAWIPFHDQLSASAGECSAAMRVLDLALDDQDGGAVRVVAALLHRCQTGLAAARALLAPPAAGEAGP